MFTVVGVAGLTLVVLGVLSVACKEWKLWRKIRSR